MSFNAHIRMLFMNRRVIVTHSIAILLVFRGYYYDFSLLLFLIFWLENIRLIVYYSKVSAVQHISLEMSNK